MISIFILLCQRRVIKYARIISVSVLYNTKLKENNAILQDMDLRKDNCKPDSETKSIFIISSIWSPSQNVFFFFRSFNYSLFAMETWYSIISAFAIWITHKFAPFLYNIFLYINLRYFMVFIYAIFANRLILYIYISQFTDESCHLKCRNI